MAWIRHSSHNSLCILPSCHLKAYIITNHLPACLLPSIHEQVKDEEDRKKNFFDQLYWMACGILVSQPGTELTTPSVEEQSPNHRTTGEVPPLSFLVLVIWIFFFPQFHLAKKFVNFVDFKGPTFYFTDFQSYFSILYAVYLGSLLYISFLPLALSLVCSFPSSFLNYKVRLLIWNLLVLWNLVVLYRATLYFDSWQHAGS